MKHYTEEQQAELQSNPYTAYVTECTIKFTKAFKEFVLKELEKGTKRKDIFKKAGYRIELFTLSQYASQIRSIRLEAASKEGLKETKLPAKESRAKQDRKRIRELEERVIYLEQAVDFLKKTHHLKKTGQLPPSNINSSKKL